MRVGIILAAIFFLLSSSATILAFTSKDGSQDDGDRVTTGGTAPAMTDVEQPASQPPATAPDPNSDGCTTENESGPGYNRSVVRCKQEATSAPQSSSGPSVAPLAPQAAPPAQVEPATPVEPEPQAQAAPQQTNPGDADPACVTEEASGDGWNRTTVRCNRRSESAGSSTSSSSVMTSSVSVSNSTSNGTP
jgi:hypothetical protein